MAYIRQVWGDGGVGDQKLTYVIPGRSLILNEIKLLMRDDKFLTNTKHPNFQMRDSRFQSLIFNSKIRLNIAKTWFLKSEIHSQMRKSTNAKQNRDSVWCLLEM